MLVLPSSAVDLAHKGGEDAEALHMLHAVADSWGLGGFSLKVHAGTAGRCIAGREGAAAVCD